MKQKVIYVAGPYRDSRGEYYVEKNIQTAASQALEVWRMGAVALCPNLNTARFGGALPDEVWLEGDLAMLERCDALLAGPGWQKSEGTKAEMVFARQHGIPVFIELGDLHDWVNSEYEDPYQEYVFNGGNCCPVCGSDNIEGGADFDFEGDKVYQDITCLACSETWTDEYTLTGAGPVEK